MEFDYGDSGRAGELLDELQKGKDYWPHQSRRSPEWIESIAKGFDRDYKIGSENIRIRLDGGSGSIEVLKFTEIVKALKSDLEHFEAKAEGSYLNPFYSPRLTRIMGDLTMESRIHPHTFRYIVEGKEFWHKGAWVDELTVHNKNAPAGREDKVGLMIYVSKELDPNGAFYAPVTGTFDSLVCCYGTVKLLRMRDAKDLVQIIQQYEVGQIGYLDIGAHGSPVSLKLPLNSTVNPKNPSDLDVSNMDQVFAGIDLEKYLTPDAQVKFTACSTGSLKRENVEYNQNMNFVDTFAKIVPNHYVSGPIVTAFTSDFAENVASNSIKDSLMMHIPGVGQIPYVYRRNEKRAQVFKPFQNATKESLERNLVNPNSKFLFYHPSRQSMVEFDASMKEELVQSIYRFPDYYSKSVLDLFQARIFENTNGFQVINPNEDLVAFFKTNGINNVQGLHFHDKLLNFPNTHVRLENGALHLEGWELKLAVDQFDENALKTLLQRGAKDPYGIALASAYQKGSLDAFTSLLESGAKDPDTLITAPKWIPGKTDFYKTQQIMYQRYEKKILGRKVEERDESDYGEDF